ncbi:MAG: RNA polymerase sigma factor [Myxococcota bacterium]
MGAPTDREQDAALIERILAGDESAVRVVVKVHGGPMLRAAQAILGEPGAAHDAVQEAWVSALRALPRFERRSSLRRWLIAIVVNQAKTLLRKQGRTVPVSSLQSEDGEEMQMPVGTFRPDGMWAGSQSWARLAIEEIEGRELVGELETAIASLPERQRAVLTLRDIEGLSCEEVCNALELSEVNQRVLLHRARTRVRAMLVAAQSARRREC